MSKKSIPVYLNIYDFTTLNTCLKVFGLAGYHSGIEIKDTEYCYCVVDSRGEETGVIEIEPESAEYRFNRKLYLGDIHMSEDELEDIVFELSKKYICGNYHMFKFNCNHFCNDLAIKLLGSGVPSWLFTTTDCLKYTCCCLPNGFLSGLWAIQAIEAGEDKMRDDIPLLANNKPG